MLKEVLEVVEAGGCRRRVETAGGCEVLLFTGPLVFELRMPLLVILRFVARLFCGVRGVERPPEAGRAGLGVDRGGAIAGCWPEDTGLAKPNRDFGVWGVCVDGLSI